MLDARLPTKAPARAAQGSVARKVSVLDRAFAHVAISQHLLAGDTRKFCCAEGWREARRLDSLSLKPETFRASREGSGHSRIGKGTSCVQLRALERCSARALGSFCG